MAIKTLSPFKLGGAIGYTIASGCLTIILLVLAIRNLGIIHDQSRQAKAGVLILIASLQLFNFVTFALPLRGIVLLIFCARFALLLSTDSIFTLFPNIQAPSGQDVQIGIQFIIAISVTVTWTSTGFT